MYYHARRYFTVTYRNVSDVIPAKRSGGSSVSELPHKVLEKARKSWERKGSGPPSRTLRAGKALTLISHLFVTLFGLQTGKLALNSGDYNSGNCVIGG